MCPYCGSLNCSIISANDYSDEEVEVCRDCGESWGLDEFDDED